MLGTERVQEIFHPSAVCLSMVFIRDIEWDPEAFPCKEELKRFGLPRKQKLSLIEANAACITSSKRRHLAPGWRHRLK